VAKSGLTNYKELTRSQALTSQQTSYDRVPYKSHPFPQSHPNRLATIATLFGLQPPPIASARVLELGCASGGNLLPMAEQFPQASFVGIDASSRQIEDGQRLLRDSGLKNAELRYQDILQFPLNGAKFDYIICHGVYSWVPNAVQQKILSICSQCLSPSGVAYVSYNTHPGWRMRGMIRDIMRYRAQFFDTPNEKLSQARGLLAFLSNSVKTENNPYGMMLRQELESLDKCDDSYLQHEHLEDINEPVYFHEFIGRADSVGLQYLGEADFGVMSVDSFGPQIRGMLKSVSRDRVELEQYMDFLRNRSFRQTLLCHRAAPIVREPQATSLLKLRVASSAEPEGGPVELNSAAQTVFRRRKAILRTTDPVVRAAYLCLRRIWPASISFNELSSIARSMAGGHPVAAESDLMSAASQRLAGSLLKSFATSMVDLSSCQRSFVLNISERPKASVLARCQSVFTPRVTNLLHERVSLDEFQCQVLRACDGTHDRADLVQSLCDNAARGDLVIVDGGIKLTVDTTIREMVTNFVPQILKNLAHQALLIE
jgi:methyltransferase-like protein/2-polyprenyl-3-methyl-5-hydroxy-6-metoxy-1,4-benzoquinol methylase